MRLLELVSRERDPVVDLACRLRRTLAEAALELGDVRGNEDRAGGGRLLLDAQRAFNETMDTYYSAQATYRRAHAKLALITGKDILP